MKYTIENVCSTMYVVKRSNSKSLTGINKKHKKALAIFSKNSKINVNEYFQNAAENSRTTFSICLS
jgi:hypothetical protein